MAISKLYVIGNGFDIHHGMKSKYWNFKEYLKVVDTQLLDKLEEYFGDDSLWSDFEATLAYLDTDQIVDECSMYLVSYGADDWKDSNHHAYQYEVQSRIDIVTKDLKNRFTDWALQLQLPINVDDYRIVLDASATFINFNYTDTLERLYKVSEANIFYIHNKALNKDSNLILGHGRSPESRDKLSGLYKGEELDTRVEEANRILDSYFETTYKSTKEIIGENIDFFDSLNQLDEIYVLGHSLSEVDLPYFVEIIKRIDRNKVKWKISFHNKKDIARYSEIMKNLGISEELISYETLTNLDSKQLSLF